MIESLGDCRYIVQTDEWHVPEEYKLAEFIGSGAYGAVCRAKQHEENEVAIKKIANVLSCAAEGLRILREVAILRRLKHPNIVRIVDIYEPPNAADLDDLYVVFEFGGMDLSLFLKHHAVRNASSGKALTEADIQLVMFNLACGLEYMHESLIIHRDLKPANILVCPKTLQARIADFGLARVLSSDCSFAVTADPNETLLRDEPRRLQRAYSVHVVTRWYRAPEVILTEGLYSQAIDIWAMGCIFAEMFFALDPASNGRALFPGRSSVHSPSADQRANDKKTDQLNVIFDVIGTPTPQDIDRANVAEDKKSLLRSLHPKAPAPLSERLTGVASSGVTLLAAMLRFLPSTRPTAKELVVNSYFASLVDKKPNAAPAADCMRKLDLESQIDGRDEIGSVQRMLRREVMRQVTGLDDNAPPADDDDEDDDNLIDSVTVRRVFSDVVSDDWTSSSAHLVETPNSDSTEGAASRRKRDEEEVSSEDGPRKRHTPYDRDDGSS